MNYFFNKVKNILGNFIRLVKRGEPGFKNGLSQIELDKKLVFSLSKSRWPSLKQFKYVGKYLNKSERLIVLGCLAVMLFSAIFLATRFYRTHLETVPIAGGEYVEGTIGIIQYINPLYSIFPDVNSDISNLVFSSLFKRGENSELINDLARGYKISPDGKTYTIRVRTDALWHNGSQLIVDDIIFTFEAIKNPQYKSPLRSGFTGVEIEKVDQQTIKFNLSEPYAAFLDLLTFGILPQEIWQQIEPASANLAELNLKPIGSGIYKFKSLVKDKSGNIRAYNLVVNDDYYGGQAHITNLTFKLFGNTIELISALNSDQINGISFLPEQEKNELVARDALNLYRLNLPKLAAVFFNTKAEPALADKKVRQALAYAIDKDRLISEVISGNARVIHSPILLDDFFAANAKKYDYNLATSSRLLNEAGWKIVDLKEEDINKAKEDLASSDEAVKKQAQVKIDMGAGQWLLKDNNYLVITLTAADNQEYGKAAELIAEDWLKINVKTKINLVAANQIQSSVIKTRNFSALLFSEIVGADPDPYPFWHSSQAGQAGLNLADYSNREVDKLLEEGRLTSDTKARQDKYIKFQEILAEDEPAIFLYSPHYTYVQSKNVKGFNVKSIILPSDRFTNVNNWFIKTAKKIIW